MLKVRHPVRRRVRCPVGRKVCCPAGRDLQLLYCNYRIVDYMYICCGRRTHEKDHHRDLDKAK